MSVLGNKRIDFCKRIKIQCDYKQSIKVAHHCSTPLNARCKDSHMATEELNYLLCGDTFIFFGKPYVCDLQSKYLKHYDILDIFLSSRALRNFVEIILSIPELKERLLNEVMLAQEEELMQYTSYIYEDYIDEEERFARRTQASMKPN